MSAVARNDGWVEDAGEAAGIQQNPSHLARDPDRHHRPSLAMVFHRQFGDTDEIAGLFGARRLDPGRAKAARGQEKKQNRLGAKARTFALDLPQPGPPSTRTRF